MADHMVFVSTWVTKFAFVWAIFPVHSHVWCEAPHQYYVCDDACRIESHVSPTSTGGPGVFLTFDTDSVGTSIGFRAINNEVLEVLCHYRAAAAPRSCKRGETCV